MTPSLLAAAAVFTAAIKAKLSLNHPAPVAEVNASAFPSPHETGRISSLPPLSNQWIYCIIYSIRFKKFVAALVLKHGPNRTCCFFMLFKSLQWFPRVTPPLRGPTSASRISFTSSFTSVTSALMRSNSRFNFFIRSQFRSRAQLYRGWKLSGWTMHWPVVSALKHILYIYMICITVLTVFTWSGLRCHSRAIQDWTYSREFLWMLTRDLRAESLACVILQGWSSHRAEKGKHKSRLVKIHKNPSI